MRIFNLTSIGKSVGTAEIENGAVTNIKLGALAVNSAKLAVDAVETGKIKDLAVTFPKASWINEVTGVVDYSALAGAVRRINFDANGSGIQLNTAVPNTIVLDTDGTNEAIFSLEAVNQLFTIELFDGVTPATPLRLKRGSLDLSGMVTPTEIILKQFTDVAEPTLTEDTALAIWEKPTGERFLIYRDSAGVQVKVELNSGGSFHPHDYNYSDGTNAFIKTTSTSFATIAKFIFGGTTAEGTPARVKILANKTAGATSIDVRIQDVTNTETIADVNITSTAEIIATDATLGTLPAAEAIFHVQARKTGGTGSDAAEVSAISLQ